MKDVTEGCARADTDCWKPGSGFVTETSLAALYDSTLEEPVPEDMTKLLDQLN